MVNNATGAGMGTSGLVGPIMTYQTMVPTEGIAMTLVKIAAFQFVLPALLSLGICQGMRRIGYIRDGDMKLDI